MSQTPDSPQAPWPPPEEPSSSGPERHGPPAEPANQGPPQPPPGPPPGPETGPPFAPPPGQAPPVPQHPMGGQPGMAPPPPPGPPPYYPPAPPGPMGPMGPGGPAGPPKTIAILALVFGAAALLFGFIPIAGIFLGGLFGIAAIVLGILGIFKSHRLMSIIGVALAVLGLIVAIVITVSVGKAAEDIIDDWPTTYEYEGDDQAGLLAG